MVFYTSGLIKFLKKDGQTLVEAVIALAVAMLIISVLVVVTSNSVNNARLAEQRGAANRLLSSTLDEVRIVRDQQGWEVFNDYGIGVVLLCYEIDTDNWELNPIGSGDLECENKALGDRTVDGFTFRRRITLCVYDSTGQTCNLSPSHDQIEEDPRLVTVEVLWNLIDPSDWLSGKVERVASSIILTRWAND